MKTKYNDDKAIVLPAGYVNPFDKSPMDKDRDKKDPLQEKHPEPQRPTKPGFPFSQ